jgi:hypothetical protein
MGREVRDGYREKWGYREGMVWEDEKWKGREMRDEMKKWGKVGNSSLAEWVCSGYIVRIFSLIQF